MDKKVSEIEKNKTLPKELKEVSPLPDFKGFNGKSLLEKYYKNFNEEVLSKIDKKTKTEILKKNR